MPGKWQGKLKNEYEKSEYSGAFSGKKAFTQHFVERNPRVPKKHLSKFFRDNDIYTLYKPTRKRFKRDKVWVTDINDTWFCDLVDVVNLKKF